MPIIETKPENAVETSHFLQYMVMFLLAAVIAVSVSRRFGLGAVLGYLGAGALIGPQHARPDSGHEQGQ